MKLQTILLELGIPSNEIKQRIKNNQIKLNGDIITNSKIELDINENFICDINEFYLEYVTKSENNDADAVDAFLKFCRRKCGYTFDELFNNPKIDIFSEFMLLRVGKKIENLYVLMKN